MNAPVRAIALALAIFAMACVHAVAASPLDDAMAGYKYLRVERHGAILSYASTIRRQICCPHR